jgi:WD40 repeat protein
VIENSPLQVYGSALLFSPNHSLVRKLFQHEELREIAHKPAMSDEWSACLQTFEGHSDGVSSVAFSPDSTRLASASLDSTIKMWDVSSGACLQTFEGHSDWVTSVAFSPDLTRLASASEDSTVKIWDASSGACLQTLESHSRHVTSVAFSPDSTRLASASWDMTVKMWDASSGACLQTLKGHSHWTNLVAFSTDSMRLASASWDCTIKIWDVSSGAYLQTLEGHSGLINSVAFSHDSKRLASASDDNTVKIWDANSGACLQTLGVGKSLYSLLFDTTGSYILTEIGSMDVSSTIVFDAKKVTELAQRPKHVDIGVSLDNTWITCSGKKLVWIPSEYRPTCSSVCGNTIGIGTRSGRVWFVVFTSAMS